MIQILFFVTSINFSKITTHFLDALEKKRKTEIKLKKKHTHTNNKEANKNNSKRECGKKPVKENMTDKTLSTYTYFELEIPRDK